MAEEENKSQSPAENAENLAVEKHAELAVAHSNASSHDSHGHGHDDHGHSEEGPVDTGKPIPEKNWQDSFLSILAVVVLGGFLYIGNAWSHVEPVKEVEESKAPEIVAPRLIPPSLNPLFKNNPMKEMQEPSPNSRLAP